MDQNKEDEIYCSIKKKFPIPKRQSYSYSLSPRLVDEIKASVDGYALARLNDSVRRGTFATIQDPHNHAVLPWFNLVKNIEGILTRACFDYREERLVAPSEMLRSGILSDDEERVVRSWASDSPGRPKGKTATRKDGVPIAVARSIAKALIQGGVPVSLSVKGGRLLPEGDAMNGYDLLLEIVFYLYTEGNHINEDNIRNSLRSRPVTGNSSEKYF